MFAHCGERMNAVDWATFFFPWFMSGLSERRMRWERAAADIIYCNHKWGNESGYKELSLIFLLQLHDYRLSLVPLVISRCHSITELQFGLEMLPEVWMLFPAYLYGINTVIGNISRIVTDKKIRPRPIHSIEVITNNLWNFQANRSSRLRAIGEQTDY